MTHLEAQNKIKSCADELTLTVSRYVTMVGGERGGCGVSSSCVLVWQQTFHAGLFNLTSYCFVRPGSQLQEGDAFQPLILTLLAFAALLTL